MTRTRQDLLDALTVERFTYLPQHPPRPIDADANRRRLDAQLATRGHVAPIVTIRRAS